MSLPNQKPKASLDRLPPYSLEAEQGIISCLLQDPATTIPQCIERIKRPTFFYDLRHQTIYDLLLKMWDEQKPIDLITVQQTLKDAGQLESIGGLLYLNEITDAAPSSLNLTYYLEIVHNKFVRRRAIQAATAIVSHVWDDETTETDEVLDFAERQVMDIGQERFREDDKNIKTLVNSAIGIMEQMHQNQGKVMGLPTGFTDLDKMTSGLEPGQMVVIAARPSMGKAQPLTSMVLTPGGFTEMGCLSVGSQIIGRDGRTHMVTGVFPQGVLPVYKVLLSDGTSTRCCGEHLWFTQTRNDRRVGLAGSVKSTLQISRTVTRLDSSSPNHAVPVVHPIDFGEFHDLPIHPWVLGALIGDGTLRKQSLLFSKPESDLQHKLIALLPKEDKGEINGMDVRITRRNRDNTPSETRIAIDRLGLSVGSCEKFVPKRYLFASPYDRLELLRGLLDTDGYVVGTCVEFSTSSVQLAVDIAFLVRSLGGICSTPKSRVPTYTYNGEQHFGATSYRMNIWFSDPSLIPVSSVKAVSRLKLAERHRHRSIVSVEPDGVEDCQCISVDSPDHLYVTDDFIVTHNTSVAINIAEHVAIDLGLAVGVFSLEMTADSLVMRMLCSRARINLRSLRDGILTERDFPRITGVAGKLSKAPIHIDDSSGLSILQLRAKARRMHQQHGLKLLIIDYLQLLNSSNRRAENRQQEIADISGGIKALAKELNIPVIVLSQLNRDIEKDKGRRPRLSDLRESGAIEQDADIVGLLYKPASDDDEAVCDGDAQAINLYIAKQRNGPTGDVNLTFLRAYTRFESAAKVSAEDAPADWHNRD